VDTINLSIQNDVRDILYGIEESVTFDELERKLAKFTQKNEVEPLAKLNRKQAEENRQADLARKAVEAKRYAEFNQKVAELERKTAEAERFIELSRKQAEEKRQAGLARKAADAKHLAEINRKVAELDRKTADAKRLAELKRREAEEKRQKPLARKAAEAERLAELKRIEVEEKRQKTLARKAVEAKRLAELKRIEAEEKRQKTLARKAVEAKRLAELKRIEAEEKRQKTLARFGSYHALVIGNNDYAHLPKLENAVQDARDVADVLERLYGFEVQTIENASRSDIIGALVKLRAKLTWDNNLLIYYAGHGTVDEYTSRGYWLPVGAEEEDLTNWVANSTITSMLKAIRAKHIMVVADSCYSGTLVRSAQGGLRTAKEQDAWVQRASQKRSRTALVSGGIEPVMDGGGGKNSVFAKALLDVLQNNQSVVDGATLFDGLKRNVVLGSEQTPQYSDIRNSEHDGGEFFFVRKTLPLNQSSAPAGADSLKAIKTECAALGFSEGTEKHGDCVMKLFR
jgi:hypothetical protein